MELGCIGPGSIELADQMLIMILAVVIYHRVLKCSKLWRLSGVFSCT